MTTACRAFLDANVFVTAWTADVLLTLAERNLLKPHWTAEVMAEAERAIRRVYSDSTDAPRRRLQAIDDAFPLAMTAIEEDDFGGIELPDPNDRHVVAGAVAAQCDVIVTYNLKDFPTYALEPLGIAAFHPDRLLFNLAQKEPATVRSAVKTLVGSKRRPPRSMEDELRGLRANGLTRFADLLEETL